MAVIAAFDVDGTLTSRDCVRPFLITVAGHVGLTVALARRAGPLLRALTDRDRVKELVVGGALGGRNVDDVERLGERFATLVYDRWLRPDTVARLRWHQRCEHRVVLVSASLGPYLRPLGGLLGVDDVLCTDLRHDGGVYLDELDRGNCRGPEKVRRLDAWLEQSGVSDPWIWAYGDSAGDADLLERADRSERVGRCVVPATPEEAVR